MCALPPFHLLFCSLYCCCCWIVVKKEGVFYELGQSVSLYLVVESFDG